jgi:glycopeptide antibiotics resistance protein
MKKGMNRWTIWLIVYVCYLMILTLSPFDFSLDHFKGSGHSGLLEIAYKYTYFNPGDMAGNILLFIPLGFLLRKIRSGGKMQGVKVLIAGGMLSFLIEFLQLFVDRSTNSIDIVMNVAGTGAGFLFAGFLRAVPKINWKIPISAGLGLYSAALIWLFWHIPSHTSPEDWRYGYPLIIGNEVSLDRPWKGALYWIALYDRALTEAQSACLFHAGLDSNTVKLREPLGLFVCYPLTRGEGSSLVDPRTPDRLPLEGDSIEWLPGRGIRCDGGLISSVGPADPFIKAVKQSGEFSVEVWCEPVDITQSGPARMVSVSCSTELRNFTLAQQGRELHLRVRSELGGLNGSDINLRARNVLKGFGPRHFIATFHHGVEQLFAEGHRHPDVIYGHISYLPALLGLGRGAKAQAGILLALFFPAGILIRGLVRRGGFMWTLLYSAMLVFLIDLYYIIQFSAPVCVPFYAIAVPSAWLGCWVAGMMCSRVVESSK